MIKMAVQYPLNTDYEKALAQGNTIFSSLDNIELIPSRMRPIKYYTFGAGSYASVFKAKIDGIITNYPDLLNDIKMCNIV